MFYLHSGLTDESRVLAVFAGAGLAGRKPAATVIFEETDVELRGGRGCTRRMSRNGWDQVELLPVSRGADSPRWVDHLKGKKVEVVFVLRVRGSAGD